MGIDRTAMKGSAVELEHAVACVEADVVAANRAADVVLEEAVGQDAGMALAAEEVERRAEGCVVVLEDAVLTCLEALVAEDRAASQVVGAAEEDALVLFEGASAQGEGARVGT